MATGQTPDGIPVAKFAPVGWRRYLWPWGAIGGAALILSVACCGLGIGIGKVGWQEWSSPSDLPPIVSQQQWKSIFAEIQNKVPHENDRIKRMKFCTGVFGYSSRLMNESTAKFKSGNTADGIHVGLTGNLLSWYGSEISSDLTNDSAEFEESWNTNRQGLAKNREMLFSRGLSRAVFQKSFANMNAAARSLGLPKVGNPE
jgi:hypothetical protein